MTKTRQALLATLAAGLMIGASAYAQDGMKKDSMKKDSMKKDGGKK